MRIALTYPGSVIAAHLNYANFAYTKAGEGEPNPAEGAAADERRNAWAAAEGGYSHLHATKPQTIGAALNDSPAGLAAWMLEKFHGWSDRTTSEDRIPYPLNHLLTNLSIYWFTGTITSSMRIYRESAADPLILGGDHQITVPVGFAAFPHELPVQPRSRLADVADLRQWTVMPRGGHFAAMEAPDLLAADIRTLFGPLIPHG